MLLKDLLDGLDVVEIKGDTNVEISSIAYDSRKVRNGSVFVCISGFKSDGHDYAPIAVSNGASVLLAQKDINVEGATVVRVKDTRYALAYISDVFYGHPSSRFKLIGVTGTKGKTTTTYMLKSIYEKMGQKVGLIGTISNMIGNEVLPAERTTPESKDLQSLFNQMCEKNVDSVVMEVSSHALELHRVSCSDFDIGIFTNLSRDHLDFHGNFENYLNAKIKLFDMCKTGLINIDNEYGREVVKRAGCETLTIGIDKDADIKAYDINTHSYGVEFKASTPWGILDLNVNIPGKFSIYNALSASGAALLTGVSTRQIEEGLGNVIVPGRAEIAYAGDDFTIIIDYAHSPDSLQNILTTVKEYAPSRVVCVFGCGGDRDRTKRPIMGEISGKLADFTIITSDNPRTEEPISIIREIEEGIKGTKSPYICIEDRREAIKYSILNAQEKDVIILAGKGHETYQMFSDKTIHFDEREVVKEILDNRKSEA
ncbi:MAG TPA: UDP-N-acetylmuramoyl-L-alanyl-D-glutamate--2,6-diaminopimelate ligase [Clostridia bacterium]